MKRTNLKPYCLLALTVIGLALFVLYFDTVCLGAARLVRILFPFFLGAAIAFVLNRPFEFFRSLFGRRNLSPKAARLLSVCTVYILALGAAALLACLAVPQLLENLALFSENVGQYLAQAEDFLQRAAARFGIEGLSFSRAASFLQESAGPLAASAQPVLPRIADATAGLFTGAANLFIGIVLSVYLLNGKDMLLAQVRRLCRAYLPPRAQRISRRLARTVIQVFDDYVAGQCKEAVILGVLCFAGMTVLRLSYSALISALIAVTALVPVVGAYLGGGVAALLLLFVSPRQAAVFLVFLVILQQVEGNILYPRVVGRKIGLPGLWVLLGVCVGGGLAGIPGVLLAVPVTTVFYQLLKEDIARRESRQEELSPRREGKGDGLSPRSPCGRR